ncbi:MAG: carboxypeptidase M32 [Armatimonadetes bacterium]|nr:carboxypeptidase M32 [Anaerolineae bacterium]
MSQHLQALQTHLAEISHLRAATALLEWDMQVNMPPKGAAARGEQMATLVRMMHEMFTSDQTARLLDSAETETQTQPYESDAASLVRVVRHDYAEATRLPAAFVAESSQVFTAAHEVWANARAKDDFASFEPTLTHIIDLTRRRADYLSYSEHPYDALLNEFERDMTTAQVKAIFDGHRPELVALLEAISANTDRVDASILHQPFDVNAQRDFAAWVVTQFGFDFERGRHDVAVHPFASGTSRNDVRLTNRYAPDFFNTSLFGMMHEAGHGMYEQGSAPALEYTPLAGGSSLGVHESQSRMWENLVGRSQGFWQWALPELQKRFPAQFGKASLETVYTAFNKVQPSFIRVEADEATYNLHIMMRFELETALLNGELQAAQLPQAWNDRCEAYLGIVPPDNRQGVLQDVHWSAGLIGYFPTYALGNLLAVQYYEAAVAAVPSIPADIAQGNFNPLLTWLNHNIHQHGRKFTMNELTQQVTGTSIDAAPYMRYLQTKFGALYGV